MNKNFFLRNSTKNIARYRSKYLLFGILFFITVFALSVSLSVFFNSAAVLEAFNRELLGTFRVTHTPQTSATGHYMAAFEKEHYPPILDNQYVEQLSFVNYRFSTALIKGAEYTTPNYRLSPEILAQNPNATPPSPPAHLSVELRTQSGAKALNDFFYNPVYVIGLNLEELNPSDRKQFVLSKGRMYENDDECIIAVSSTIPGEEWNLLDVGDIIAMRTAENTYKEYTVVGILWDNTDLGEEDQTRVLFTTFDSALFFKSSITGHGYLMSPGAMPPVRSGRVNTPIDFTTNVRPVSERPEVVMPEALAGLGVAPSYDIFEGVDVLVRLNSYEYAYYEAAVKELNAIGYGASSLYFDRAVFSINMMIVNAQSQSGIFMWIIAIFIVAVIATMTIMLLNNRKYEIAVLRSVGMRKGRLIAGYVAENLVFIWGIAIAALISAQGAYYLFLHQGLMDGVYMRFMPDSPCPLILQNVGITFGGVTAVALLTLVFAAVYIVRFEPLKIFNKRH